MTNLELNRDIKRLGKRVKQARENHTFLEHEAQFKREFLRLHNADRGLEYTTFTSFKIMHAINKTFVFVPYNRFYSKVSL